MNSTTIKEVEGIVPSDIAKYYLVRSFDDGDLVSNLKMQKLVYYAYVWSLVKNKKKIFKEEPEAWPNGPAFKTLYGELKKYGSEAIKEDYVDRDVADIEKLIPTEIKETIDDVYEKYNTLTPFELVLKTHTEDPWKNAREGLGASDPSNQKISVGSILTYYH